MWWCPRIVGAWVGGGVRQDGGSAGSAHLVVSAVVFELLVVVLLAIVFGVSSWDGSTAGSAHLVVFTVRSDV